MCEIFFALWKIILIFTMKSWTFVKFSMNPSLKSKLCQHKPLQIRSKLFRIGVKNSSLFHKIMLRSMVENNFSHWSRVMTSNMSERSWMGIVLEQRLKMAALIDNSMYVSQFFKSTPETITSEVRKCRNAWSSHILLVSSSLQ